MAINNVIIIRLINRGYFLRMTRNVHTTLDPVDNVLHDGRLRQAQLKMYTMLTVIDAICLKHDLDYWLDAGTLLGAVRHQGFIPWDDDLDIAMPRASYEAFLTIAPREIPATMWLQTAQTDPGYFNLAAPLKIRDKTSRFIEKHELGDEPYVQGIFIDVFVYDRLPVCIKQRRRYKWLAKKLSRLLGPKYSQLSSGHHSAFYRNISKCLPKKLLEYSLQSLINKANACNSPYLGRGYNCIGNNVLTYDDVYPLKRIQFEAKQFNSIQHPEIILSQQYGDYLSIPPKHQQILRHCKELTVNSS
jgi:lipopolysaccharide cholinephosphotransferase